MQKYKFVSSPKMSPRTYLPCLPSWGYFCRSSRGLAAISFCRKAAMFFGRNFLLCLGFTRHFGKDVKKCELVVSDGTAVIAATIWEDVIETVKEGQAYVFGDVRVGYFNKTYLQCAQSSTISPCIEEIKTSEAMLLEAEKLKPKETESEEIVGRILTADISKLYVCVNCNGRIPAEDDNDPEMVKCTSCRADDARIIFVSNIVC